MKEKEIHFWFDEQYPEDTYHSYYYASWLIGWRFDLIHTTQIALISTKLITEKGYRIFIHDHRGKMFEITLGSCDRIDREITESMNLEKMLLNGAFGDVTGII